MDPRHSRTIMFCVDLSLQLIGYFVPFACNLTTCEPGPNEIAVSLCLYTFKLNFGYSLKKKKFTCGFSRR